MTLTDRESQVAQFLVKGATNAEIGTQLGIATHTAKFHVDSIKAKLGVDNRTKAAVRLVTEGLERELAALRDERDTLYATLAERSSVADVEALLEAERHAGAVAALEG